MHEQNIRLGRLHECTFQQALILRQRGFEGYREKMIEYYPGYGTISSSSIVNTDSGALTRLLDGFGTGGIHPDQSVVCFVDNQPVGFVFIAYKHMNGKKLAWNGGTGVFPEYRGMGIAKAMMTEMRKLVEEQEVDRAVLEVVVKNTHAVAAYEQAGFRIVDKLVGMVRYEPLNPALFDKQMLPGGISMRYGGPDQVSGLSFYREHAAWMCMWHNMKHGESVLATNEQGIVVGYALIVRAHEKNGQLKSVTLHQCEVSPDFEDRPALFRLLLSEVFGPVDMAFERQTNDLSMSNPQLVDLLFEAGFILRYEQYLMHLERIGA